MGCGYSGPGWSFFRRSLRTDRTSNGDAKTYRVSQVQQQVLYSHHRDIELTHSNPLQSTSSLPIQPPALSNGTGPGPPVHEPVNLNSRFDIPVTLSTFGHHSPAPSNSNAINATAVKTVQIHGRTPSLPPLLAPRPSTSTAQPPDELLNRRRPVTTNQTVPLERLENDLTLQVGSISYSKISVREPLAKVLADRAALEHYYQEVDQERLSSFYEEIGSTNSSVTYTKITDVIDGPLPNGGAMAAGGPSAAASSSSAAIIAAAIGCSNMAPSSSPPPPPSVDRLLEVAVSGSRSTSPHSSTHGSTTAADSSNLYAYVDKTQKMSKGSKRAIAYSADVDDLYAKVQKSPVATVRSARLSSPSLIGAASAFASNSPATNGFADKHQQQQLPTPLRSSAIPPPVPPTTNIPPRSAGRCTSALYTAPILSHGGHQRRHSHPYHTEMSDARVIEEQTDPGYYGLYEVVPNDPEDNEPTYEQISEIGRELTHGSHLSSFTGPMANGRVGAPAAMVLSTPGAGSSYRPPLPLTAPAVEREQVRASASTPLYHEPFADPGYEMVKPPAQEKYEDSDGDPGYEVIASSTVQAKKNGGGKKPTMPPRQDSEPDAGYEVIGPPAAAQPAVQSRTTGVQRMDSDLSQEDPGYERVRYVRRAPGSPEPTYASIVKEDFTERL